MYRFGSNADALAAALVYATALGISEREARQIAGLPVASRLVDPWSLPEVDGDLRVPRRRLRARLVRLPPGARLGEPAAATPAAASQTPGRRPDDGAPRAVGDPGRRLQRHRRRQRRREHGQPSRRPRVPDRQGRERKARRLPEDARLLPAGRTGDRRTARPRARHRHRSPAGGRQPEPPRRHRRRRTSGAREAF